MVSLRKSWIKELQLQPKFLNFELNFDDGEIRYKTSIDTKGSLLTLEAFKDLVYTNVLTVDQYLPGILSVISGTMSPEEAIAKIEN